MKIKLGMSRRALLASSASLILPWPALAANEVIHVYKSSTCGCCNQWIAHLRANGFEVEGHDVDDTATVRTRLGVPRELASCHTATIDGYLVEGHVPASDIRRLLRERPAGAGLAVPGMPRGSPGMPSEVADPFNVLLFQPGGRHVVYQRYGG